MEVLQRRCSYLTLDCNDLGQHLRLVDLRPYDSGLYVCRAENPLGRVEAQAALTVISEDQPLVLLSKPYDVTAPRGTTIQLPCRAQGGEISLKLGLLLILV